MIKLSEMSYDELTDHARYVLDELRTKAYAAGYEHGHFDGMTEVIEDIHDDRNKINYELSEEIGDKLAQVKRDEIVERAKKDVKELSTTYLPTAKDHLVSFWPKECEKDGFARVHNVEFVVNREKRTVVALIINCNTGKVDYRGIAKCAPGDCFNAYIGKAIALRRALRLDVPDEYLNAPQPTEVRVDDIIKYECDKNPAKVVEEFNMDEGTRSLEFVKKYKGYGYMIIDDSRYGDE